VEAARSAATRTSLLAVFGAHGLLMAFALKLKIAAVLRRRRGRGGADDGAGVGGGAEPYFEPPHSRGAAARGGGGGGHSVFLTYCRALRRDASVAAVIEALAVQGLGWAPSLANAVVLAVFVLGLAINPTGAPEAVFMLSPVLLMLSQDPLLCWGVASRQRYAPPVLAAAGYLALRASLGITSMSLHRELFWGALRNWALLAGAAPMHSLFVAYLWTQRRQSPWLVLALALPCGAAVAFADVEAAWHLGATGLLEAVVLFFGAVAGRSSAASAGGGGGRGRES
jgi:hypothetical protein